MKDATILKCWHSDLDLAVITANTDTAWEPGEVRINKSL